MRTRRSAAGNPCPPRRRRASDSSFVIRRSAFSPAFTLLELVLVMAIITVIVMMAVPTLRGFGRGRAVSDTATQIIALTEYARTQAIATGQSYRLNLDAAGRRYFLTADQGDGTFAELGEESGRPFTLPETVNLQWDAPQQSDGQYVTFLPTGRVEPSTLILSDTENNVVQVASQSASEAYRVLSQDAVLR